MRNHSNQPKNPVPYSTDAVDVDLKQQNGLNKAVDQPVKDLPAEEWIKDYFGNDYSIAIPVLQIFIDEMLPEIKKLMTVLQTGGVEALRQKVHKINPAFKMVGQMRLSAALSDLESECLGSGDIDKILRKIKKIQSQTEKAQPLITKQYNILSKIAQ
jgi:HPt (histidine-containing phosphotransfer) domain-containing protein